MPSIYTIANDLEDTQRELIEQSYHQFGQMIRQQPVVRFLIDVTPGYGHQSSTTNLMRRFAAALDDSGFGLGYTGTMELLADLSIDPEPGEPTLLEKIYALLPELDGQREGRLNGARVVIVDTGTTAPDRPVFFCFTGGYDTFFSLTNSYNEIKAKTILVLQPYKYSFSMTPKQYAPGNCLLGEIRGKYYPIASFDSPLLGTEPNPFYCNLHDRAYHVPKPALTENDWQALHDTAPAPKARAISSLQWLSALFGANTVSFALLYGVNFPGATQFRDPAWDRLALVLASLWQARRTDPNLRPAILLNFSAYDPSKDVEASFGNVAGMAKGGLTPAEMAAFDILQSNTITPLERQRAQRRQSIANARRASFQRGMQDDRFLFVDITQEGGQSELEKGLTWVQQQTYRVLFVQVGQVPPPIFNLFMDNADLPAIFEGPNTANVAINTGTPYLWTQTLGKVGTGAVRYPTGALDGVDTDTPEDLQQVANLVQTSFDSWPLVAGQAPSVRIGGLAVETQNPSSAPRVYFDAVAAYYRDVLNDKFTVAAAVTTAEATKHFLQSELATTSADALTAAPATAASDGPPEDLGSLYDLLEGLLEDGTTVDVLKDVFPSGGIHDSYTGILAAFPGAMAISKAKVERLTEEDGTTTQVTLTGRNTILGFSAAKATLTFTAPAGTMSCDAAFALPDEWSLDGVPWIPLSPPTFHLRAFETGSMPTAAITTAISSIGADISIDYPIGGGALTITGDFDPVMGVAQFVNVVGGIDIMGYLPPAVQGLAGLGVKSIAMSYDPKAKALTDLSLVISTSAPWQLINNLVLDSFTVTLTVTNPGSLTKRQVAASIEGLFILNAESKAGIEVSAKVPELGFNGQLYGPELSVDDIINVFWPGGKPGWPGGNPPIINDFAISYDAGSGDYMGRISLDLKWPIVIAGTTMLTIDNVGMMVSGGTDWSTGALSGSFTVLPDSANIGLVLSAMYLGANKGWRFQAQQTSGKLELADLAKTYLGWNSGLSLTVDGLLAKIETQGPSYEFSAKTADPWQIPIDTGMTITGTMTIGYNGGSDTLGISEKPQGKADVPVTKDKDRDQLLRAADEKIKGFYGRVSADIVWKNIELTLSADMSAESYKFMITWGLFQGELDAKKKTCTIRFSAGTTLGNMVETFISWLTGSKFGLVAPWNVLDQIPLSGFELVWDFGKNKVSFNVGIGPIDLGIARIDSIGLAYVPEGEDKGVNIELNGHFIWQDDASEPLAWNAADPSSTPAPSGQGNKYFDLRLLAAGQHVALPDVVKAKNVQGAIAAMGSLEPPEAGEVPKIGFDPTTNWLFGTDFGILRIADGDKKDDGKTTLPAPLGAEAGPKYVLTLQVVFNDPVLYALRLALAGEAAKVFAGLDFQVMYRKLSDTLGVYQAEISLPTIMRRLDVGACTITLPTFGVQIYTNGDFRFDIGFPWEQDFSRSFSVEAIVPPGIPVMGSGGFYFGKLPAIAVEQLPKATNGTFNPNLVFGFGAQLGLGKSVEYGILRAGFEMTFFGIIEGILAKWNPYDAKSTGNGGLLELQGEYFFWLQGTFGILGHLYGSVDFVVVKAEVDVKLKVYAQITLAAYEPIPITVYASVDVTAKVKIDLGLFSIKLSFSFSARIKETVVLGALQNPHDAPWQVEDRTGGGRLMARQNTRLRSLAPLRAPMGTPTWDNLQKPDVPATLSGYVGVGLTVAGDAAFQDGTFDLGRQMGAGVASLFIDSVEPMGAGDRSGAEKARGAIPDTAFETLAKSVARWGIAALQSGPVQPDAVDGLRVSCDDLDALLQYLNEPGGDGVPIPAAAIEAFLSDHIRMTVALREDAGEAVAAYFPMPLALGLSTSEALDYTFGDFNSVAPDFLKFLRRYFNQLAVQVQEEEDGQRMLRALSADANDTVSVGNFIFTDYFTLILRQMVQALRDALRDFVYELKAGDTGNDIVAWFNTTGGLSGDEAVALHDLFEANADALLTPNKTLRIPFVSYTVQDSDTFASIAGKDAFGHGFDAAALARANLDTAGILRPRATVTHKDRKFEVSGSMTLRALAQSMTISVDALLTETDVLTKDKLLQPAARLSVPPFPAVTQDGDTLLDVAARHGVAVSDLAGVGRPGADNPIGMSNGDVPDLFDAASAPDVHMPHLVRFQLGALIEEAQRTGALQHLSGMVSRYYFHGMRLPTDKITPLKRGMWVTGEEAHLSLPPEAGLFALTGQQFPIPVPKDAPFTATLSHPAATQDNDPLPWLHFAGGVDQVTFTLAPPTKENPQGDLNFQRLSRLVSYASSTVLDTGLESFGAAEMVGSDSVRYPLSSALPWSSAAAIDFPVGGAAPDAQPRLWPLPSAMTGLSRTENGPEPAFALEVQRYDQASGVTTTTPMGHYGWASSVQFTVKRLPPVKGAPESYEATYEITGASAENTLVLERMVQGIGDRDAAFAALYLGYQPGASAGTADLVAESGATMTFGIAQVNLSTVTRPPAFLPLGDVGESPTTLNRPSELVRLLWEASITRAGGFYLYAVDTATGEGLPDSLFNDKGEATLTLVALYRDTSHLMPYVNAAATGDPLDLSSASVVATSVPQGMTVTVSKSDTLTALARRHSTTVLSIVRKNPGLSLATGATLTLGGGTYIVPPGGAAPGGRLDDIAAHFAMDPAGIVAANPRIAQAQWQGTLPPFTALRLPKVSRVVGTAPGGTTLESIATFYGTTAAAIAGLNAQAPGLLAEGQTLNVTVGPVVEFGSPTLAVQAVEARRKGLPEFPSQPQDPSFAHDMLLNLYTMLGYRIVETADFASSNLGLPLGPQGQGAGEDQTSKVRAVGVADQDTPLTYAKTLPYRTLVSNGPGQQPGTASPYGGNGRLLQVAYGWQDIYGNRLVTDLDDPKTESGALNRAPILLGYTDTLIPVAQWPSVGTSWTVAPSKQADAFAIVMTFDFHASVFNPDPQAPQAPWQSRAMAALPTVERMLAQYTDPNGIAFTLTSPLATSPVTVPQDLIGTLASGPDTLIGWLKPIHAFLQARAQGDSAAPAPATLSLTLAVPAPRSAVTTAEVFPLTMTLGIARTGGIAEGDFAALPGVRSVDCPLTPQSSAEGGAGSSLEAFAKAVRSTLSMKGGPELIVTNGVDRRAPASAPAAIWGVWLDAPGSRAGKGIAVIPEDPGAPEIFAPRPVSNQLVTRTETLRSYRGIDDFDPATNTLTGPEQTLSFSDIDVDTWVAQLFDSFDDLLAPSYVSSMLVVDARADAKPAGVESLLDSLADVKKKLADIAADLMAPVFVDQAASRRGSAREALRQTLLTRLSDLYSTRAAVSFGMTVEADIPDGGAPGTPGPQLFGGLSWHGEQPEFAGQVTFSSPKVPLTAGSNQPLTFLIEAPQLVSNGLSGVVERITLDLDYQGSAIEHQVAGVPGIEDYFASSWLQPVEKDGFAPLSAALGSFDVPMVLRGFPATPRMDSQQGGATLPDGSLSDLTQWTYSVGYSLDFHYEQDVVYGVVEYNLKSALHLRDASLLDAFPALAQFTTALPSLQAAIQDTVPGIDATTTDKTLLNAAARALGAYLKMVSDIAASAEHGDGLRVHAGRPRLTGTDAAPYPFHIEEKTRTFEDADGNQVSAWVVSIVSDNGPPVGLSERPYVLVDGFDRDQTILIPGLSDDATGIYAYTYRDADGPLTGSRAQTIPGRSVVLPGLQILARQDAMTTIHLSRNDNLVPGRKTAPDFVYKTPNVSFANPCHPKITRDRAIDVARLGSTNDKPVSRTLKAHLTTLFDALFANAYQGDVTLQLEVGYSYALSSAMADLAVPLPVMLQTPVTVDVGGAGNSETTLAHLVDRTDKAILRWFERFAPSRTRGRLSLDLRIMSNMTDHPMPLLQLTNLRLDLGNVTDL